MYSYDREPHVFSEKIWLSSRAVKGGRLKICCICFVGSNPTSTIFTFCQKVEPIRLASIFRLVATITAFIVRPFVRLAQSAEHRSYEPKVGSSILPANTFGAACGVVMTGIFQVSDSGSNPDIGIRRGVQLKEQIWGLKFCLRSSVGLERSTVNR